jgi:hypothetical protein
MANPGIEDIKLTSDMLGKSFVYKGLLHDIMLNSEGDLLIFRPVSNRPVLLKWSDLNEGLSTGIVLGERITNELRSLFTQLYTSFVLKRNSHFASFNNLKKVIDFTYSSLGIANEPEG